jgi:glycosyltransferase involved in cell wall biosynthesis
MSTWGVATVKDEADVIAGTLRHMADEVDHLLVLDNGSTDGTREILADLKDDLPLTIVDDPELGYWQSARMSRLAAQAADAGAEWIVPFDADELWVSPAGRVRDVLPHFGTPVVLASLTNHFCTAIDPDDEDPFRRIGWRQPQAAPLPKVAFRWEPGATIHQGNHGVTLPVARGSRPGLEIRHFPYRSAEQFIHKARNGAAAYRATDLPPTEGAHWRAYGDILDRLGEQGLAEVFNQHFFYLSPTDSGLVHDPAAYCRWT